MRGKAERLMLCPNFFVLKIWVMNISGNFVIFQLKRVPPQCTVPSLPKLQRIFFFLFFFSFHFRRFRFFYSIFAALFPATFSLPPLTFVLFHFYLKIMMKPKFSQCGREPICAHVLLLTEETQDLHRQAVTPLVPLCRSSPR